MKVQCKNCKHKQVRDMNPDFLSDDVAKVCFGQVWTMNKKESKKVRNCSAFCLKPLDK